MCSRPVERIRINKYIPEFYVTVIIYPWLYEKGPKSDEVMNCYGALLKTITIHTDAIYLQ